MTFFRISGFTVFISEVIFSRKILFIDAVIIAFASMTVLIAMYVIIKDSKLDFSDVGIRSKFEYISCFVCGFFNPTGVLKIVQPDFDSKVYCFCFLITSAASCCDTIIRFFNMLHFDSPFKVTYFDGKKYPCPSVRREGYWIHASRISFLVSSLRCWRDGCRGSLWMIVPVLNPDNPRCFFASSFFLFFSVMRVAPFLCFDESCRNPSYRRLLGPALDHINGMIVIYTVDDIRVLDEIPDMGTGIEIIPDRCVDRSYCFIYTFNISNKEIVNIFMFIVKFTFAAR